MEQRPNKKNGLSGTTWNFAHEYSGVFSALACLFVGYLVKSKFSWSICLAENIFLFVTFSINHLHWQVHSNFFKLLLLSYLISNIPLFFIFRYPSLTIISNNSKFIIYAVKSFVRKLTLTLYKAHICTTTKLDLSANLSFNARF